MTFLGHPFPNFFAPFVCCRLADSPDTLRGRVLCGHGVWLVVPYVNGGLQRVFRTLCGATATTLRAGASDFHSGPEQRHLFAFAVSWAQQLIAETPAPGKEHWLVLPGS